MMRYDLNRHGTSCPHIMFRGNMVFRTPWFHKGSSCTDVVQAKGDTCGSEYIFAFSPTHPWSSISLTDCGVPAARVLAGN